MDDLTIEVLPNPGSDEAVKLGCRCSIFDNRHGLGIYKDENGMVQFWINEDCPLHGMKKVEDAPSIHG